VADAPVGMTRARQAVSAAEAPAVDASLGYRRTRTSYSYAVTAATTSASAILMRVDEVAGIERRNPLEAVDFDSGHGTALDTKSVTPRLKNDFIFGAIAGFGSTQTITPTAHAWQNQGFLKMATSSAELGLQVGWKETPDAGHGQDYTATCAAAMDWAGIILDFQHY
jgi:hypothetical protein